MVLEIPAIIGYMLAAKILKNSIDLIRQSLLNYPSKALNKAYDHSRSMSIMPQISVSMTSSVRTKNVTRGDECE